MFPTRTYCNQFLAKANIVLLFALTPEIIYFKVGNENFYKLLAKCRTEIALVDCTLTAVLECIATWPNRAD